MAKQTETATIRRITSGVHGLDTMSFATAKKIAFEMSAMNYRELSDDTGIPLSTVKRCFTDPAYHPSPPNIPDYCQSLGNTVMLEWIAEQCGYYIVKINASPSQKGLTADTSEVIKEAADVMSAFAEMAEDGQFEEAELKAYEAELAQLIASANRALETTKRLKNGKL